MPPSQKKYNHRLYHIVAQTITAHRMFQAGDALLVGVSGGPDSVALLHVLYRLAERFAVKLGIAHLNHCLRQNESDRDEQFVLSLAERLTLPCFCKKVNVPEYRKTRRLSLEEASRQVRYQFFQETAQQHRFGKIVLAHHRDDNAELTLMYLFRGSGPLGLAGIPPVRGNIVRPLINVSKDMIIDFLDSKQLPYISDKSNQDRRFVRNRIRHDLLPALKQAYNPKIIRTVARTASILRDEEGWIEKTLEPVYHELISQTAPGTVGMSARQVKKHDAAVQRRVIRKAISTVKGDLRRIAFQHIESAIRLICNGPSSGRIDLPGKIRIAREYDRVEIVKENFNLREAAAKPDTAGHNGTASFEYAITVPGVLFVKEIELKIEFSETVLKKSLDLSLCGQRATYFDMSKLRFPMILRNVRPGDRFKPLGLNGTQKLKKFFINNKIPRSTRKKCPVLLSEGKVVWVVGHCIDDRVKVVASTQKVLKAELLLA